jgi:hypothetical protein
MWMVGLGVRNSVALLSFSMGSSSDSKGACLLLLFGSRNNTGKRCCGVEGLGDGRKKGGGRPNKEVKGAQGSYQGMRRPPRLPSDACSPLQPPATAPLRRRPAPHLPEFVDPSLPEGHLVLEQPRQQARGGGPVAGGGHVC